MITTRDLRIDYDQFCAVKDLNLEIATGHIYGLLGPNGAGKTSTMRALVGLIEPTYGDVLIDGIDLATHPEEARRKIGFMPDYPPLYEDLKVWEFLDLFAAIYKIPANDRKKAIQKSVELAGLTEKYDSFTPALSRGMKQRLMLAKTLLPNPAVIILDEPASGMDPYGRSMMKETLKALANEGHTILVSSHVLAELSEMCHSFGVMQKGEMLVSGTVEEVGRRLSAAESIEIHLVDSEQHFLQVAGELSLSPKKLETSRFELPFSGTEAEAAELLGKLIAKGIKISGFQRRKHDLEALFLKIGAKELS